MAGSFIEARVHQRIESYLREHRLEQDQVRRVAAKLARAILGTKALPEPAATLAAAALAKATRTEVRGKSSGGGFVRAMGGDDLSVYQGHGRYGSGPDLDRGASRVASLAAVRAHKEVTRRLGIFLDREKAQALAAQIDRMPGS